jgi:hypothetical protein
VHEQQLAAVLEGQTLVGGQTANAMKNDVTQGLARLSEAIEARLFLSRAGLNRCRVERGHRSIAQPLNHDGAGGAEATPRLQGLRARKNDVSCNEKLVEAAALGRRQNGAKRVELPMNVGEAKKKHR